MQTRYTHTQAVGRTRRFTHTHTHIHTHTHTYTYTHTHTHTHTHTPWSPAQPHVVDSTPVCVRARVHVHLRVPTCIHAHNRATCNTQAYTRHTPLAVNNPHHLLHLHDGTFPAMPVYEFYKRVPLRQFALPMAQEGAYVRVCACRLRARAPMQSTFARCAQRWSAKEELKGGPHACTFELKGAQGPC
jgi:hypothetical protein